MTIMKRFLIFLTGGVVYYGIELLWRGRSHGSMFAAGGLCLLLIGHLGEVEPKLPLPIRILVGTGIITMVELGMGLLANRSYSIWDYRGLPWNLWGQICPQFILLWMPLSWLAIVVYDRMKRKLA